MARCEAGARLAELQAFMAAALGVRPMRPASSMIQWIAPMKLVEWQAHIEPPCQVQLLACPVGIPCHEPSQPEVC